MILKDTNEMFADDLRDPTYAAGYLNITLEDDGIEGFLYALQKVARAHGISKVAASSDLPRESLYRALSDKGNPGIKPLARVLDSLGLCLTVSPSGSESCLAAAEGVGENLAATDAPMPQESARPLAEAAILPPSVEEGFAMLGDLAQQLSAMQEEARRERLEARQAVMALVEEVHRSHAQIEQIAAVMADKVRRETEQAERAERTPSSGAEPTATYSFPTRTGTRRINEEAYQSSSLRLVRGTA